jgi:hypothetical protein
MSDRASIARHGQVGHHPETSGAPQMSKILRQAQR